TSSPGPSISLVSAAALTSQAKRKDIKLFSASIKEIEKLAGVNHESPEEKRERLKKIVPVELHYLIHIFMKKEADKLPPYWYVDHAIELEEGAKPSFGPL